MVNFTDNEPFKFLEGMGFKGIIDTSGPVDYYCWDNNKGIKFKYIYKNTPRTVEDVLYMIWCSAYNKSIDDNANNISNNIRNLLQEKLNISLKYKEIKRIDNNYNLF